MWIAKKMVMIKIKILPFYNKYNTSIDKRVLITELSYQRKVWKVW